jgi:iron complex transport system ATP-binding protein
MLEALEISCGYGGEDVLSGVSVRISPGELTAVVGPNGSGKSTLVRALSRVLRPRSGRVLLDGKDLYDLPARAVAREIAVVPQETPLDFEFTCEEVVLMGRAPHLGRFQSEGEADRGVVNEAMERTGTRALRGRSVLELSGGERQRVVLARAFAQGPRVLLLDEPTAHLDIAFQVQVLGTVARLRRERNLAVLATLHDLNLAAAYADRVVLLSKGRVVSAGSAAEVLTEATLRDVYGAEVTVRPHPETGRPLVLVKT